MKFYLNNVKHIFGGKGYGRISKVFIHPQSAQILLHITANGSDVYLSQFTRSKIQNQNRLYSLVKLKLIPYHQSE